jgi:hypothetical protein
MVAVVTEVALLLLLSFVGQRARCATAVVTVDHRVTAPRPVLG